MYQCGDFEIDFMQELLDDVEQLRFPFNLVHELNRESTPISRSQVPKCYHPAGAIWVNVSHSLQKQQSANAVDVPYTIAQQVCT